MNTPKTPPRIPVTTDEKIRHQNKLIELLKEQLIQTQQAVNQIYNNFSMFTNIVDVMLKVQEFPENNISIDELDKVVEGEPAKYFVMHIGDKIVFYEFATNTIFQSTNIESIKVVDTNDVVKTNV